MMPLILVLNGSHFNRFECVSINSFRLSKETLESGDESVVSSRHFMFSVLLAWVTLLSASAETLLGHNLIPTSATLKRGEVMAGSYALAAGITDQWTVGTSPWLIWMYNMPALSTRYAFRTEGVFDRVTFEQLYFKTFEFGYNMYRQESTWTRLTASRRFDPFYTLHLNLGLQYFWNDQVPFSMRPIPTNRTPLTASAGMLHELHFTQAFGAFFETGLLGLNYPNRYAHLGISGFYQWNHGYIQLGVSKTLPMGAERIQTNQFEVWKSNDGVYRASVYRNTPAPFHPEFQIQVLL